jgi:hypothetical protein
MFLSIKDKEVKPEMRKIVLLMRGKELLKEVKKKQDTQFVVVRKPRIVLASTRIDVFTRGDLGVAGRVC